MIKHNQDGAVSGVGLSLIISVIFLIAAIGFGGWAFSSRQDYKNNVDGKIATAVTIAKQQESSAKDKQFVEDEKKPLRIYNGPGTYGSISLSYPKTWSGVVDETGTGGNNALLNGYFYPGIVPSISDTNTSTAFAFRMQVLNQGYSDVLQTFQGRDKPPTITPYALPRLPKVVGARVQGQIFGEDNPKAGDLVILPLRSYTLEIWTEGTQFENDFNNNILPNFTFSP
jgi:hypothetical protein